MFYALHPGPSSGGGLPLIQAKYHYKTDKPEDPIRCAMCGQVNDMDMTPSGDSFVTPGIQYGSLQTTTFNYPTPPGATQLTMTIYTIEPNVVGACRFCGTMNEPGKLVGSAFGSGIDLTNL